MGNVPLPVLGMFSSRAWTRALDVMVAWRTTRDGVGSARGPEGSEEGRSG
jgi:hypothetical protein